MIFGSANLEKTWPGIKFAICLEIMQYQPTFKFIMIVRMYEKNIIAFAEPPCSRLY